MAVTSRQRHVCPNRGLRGYFDSTSDPVVSSVVTLPLLVLYNLGLIMPGNTMMNAADILTRLMTHFSGIYGMLALNAVLGLLSVAMLFFIIRKGRFSPLFWFLMSIEGLSYGLCLGHLVLWIMGKAHILGVNPLDSLSIPQKLFLSAGAGYWEEVVFRLGMVGVPIYITKWWLERSGSRSLSKTGKVAKLIIVGAFSIVVSSFLFSLAHYLGSESFESHTFWYRTFSGILFAIIFLARGFGVVAYTHFLYDVVVMVF